MADETFRPRKPGQEEMNEAHSVREQLAQEAGQETRPVGESQVQIKGNIPAEFQKALKAASGESTEPKKGFGNMGPQDEGTMKSFERRGGQTNSDHLKELLEVIRNSNAVYEEIELPSKGKFYDGESGPADGVVSIRPMTGEEEQILATPRFVRKGQAINMIFQKCLKEGNQFKPENLLTIDRTYLLIYLRGISYSPKYEVEIKCPECETKFSTTIDLNALYVESCPDSYGPELQDTLPTTKLPFSYRLSTGRDEQDINDHRDRRIKAFGDASADDTLTFRTAALLNDIDGITNKNELQVLLKNLPINDVSYIRNCINEPPFGVDTNIQIVCPSCFAEFGIDLPLEANFFFPRRRKGVTQA
jgi:hypothetical protein